MLDVWELRNLELPLFYSMKSTSVIRQLEPISTWKTVFSLCLLILGFYSIFDGYAAGLIILAWGLRLGYRKGVEVNYLQGTYRKLHTIYGYGAGTWTKLPTIDYISLFKTTKKQRSRVITAEAHLDFIEYRVNIFYSKNKHITIYAAESYDDALVIAKQLTSALNVEFYDATKA